MKKKLTKWMTIGLMLLTGMIGIEAANKNTDKKDASAKQDAPASYLDVFHAKERAYSLKAQNRADIYRLKIIVSNFGDSDTKGKFDKILSDYKEGVKVLYKNQFINADEMLNQNRNDIRKLYQVFVMQYQTKASDILNNCADKLVDTELAESIEPGSGNRSRNKLIMKVRNRLAVAYSQLMLGTELEKTGNLPESIAHFRVAKFHGIQILKDLAENEDERRKIEDQFRVDIADSQNMTANKTGKSS